MATFDRGAFFDVDGTLVSTNVVHAYAYYVFNRGTIFGTAQRLIKGLAMAPAYAIADRYNRKVFNELFYRAYRGLSEDRLIELAQDLCDKVLAPAVYPGALDIIAECRKAGCKIVLCTGAIGSPHLLLLSGIGPADHLRAHGIAVRADLPGVGQNLRDHPHVYATWRPAFGYPMNPDRQRYQTLLRYTAPGSELRNDVQILMSAFATARVDRGGDGRTPVGLTLQPVLNLARSAGELRLQSPDPTVQPLLDYNLLADPSDRERLREALRLCLELGRHPAFAGILGERLAPADADLASDGALDAWMLREVTTTNHVSGTCRMGRGGSADPLAVVDQRGRVHGLEGLRVADASIMPDCVRANTNATCLMIGERMADLMLEGS
jgi:choline dehydrogenase-like flavoprotein